MAKICDECNGKGKFKAYEITLGAGIIRVPEQECGYCKGKGFMPDKLSQLKGIAPDITGGLSSEDYVRKERG